LGWYRQCYANSICFDNWYPGDPFLATHPPIQRVSRAWSSFLKLINNSSSLNKGNHDRDGVWISYLNKHRFLRFYFSVFSLVLVSVEKYYVYFSFFLSHMHADVYDNRILLIYKHGFWNGCFTTNQCILIKKMKKGYLFIFKKNIRSSILLKYATWPSNNQWGLAHVQFIFKACKKPFLWQNCIKRNLVECAKRTI